MSFLCPKCEEKINSTTCEWCGETFQEDEILVDIRREVSPLEN